MLPVESEREWLSNVKPRDLAYIEQDNHFTAVAVARVTDTQIVIERGNVSCGKYEIKFKKSNGERIGGGSAWHPETLVCPTDERAKVIMMDMLTVEAIKYKRGLQIPTEELKLRKFLTALSEFQVPEKEAKKT